MSNEYSDGDTQIIIYTSIIITHQHDLVKYATKAGYWVRAYAEERTSEFNSALIFTCAQHM